jgi:serine/threonine protein kinase
MGGWAARVAIKVLPAAFAQDADRRVRFEREAKAIAALSHPNILAIFDIGTHADQMFVVTELLHGETLRKQLKPAGSIASGSHVRLPVGRAIDVATQIANGLAAAHDKGIVHREPEGPRHSTKARQFMDTVPFFESDAHNQRITRLIAVEDAHA